MRRMLMAAAVLAALVLSPAAGAWTWPVGGEVLQPFTFDPAHPYAGGQHRGIDIAASAGADVVAPAAGTVTFAGAVPASGKSITIATGDGLAVTLTHLGSIGVSEGAALAEGAVLGTVGPSGDPEVAGAYLHLGIRVADEPQGYRDPLAYLPSRAASAAPPASEAPAAPVSSPAASAAPPSPAPSAPTPPPGVAAGTSADDPAAAPAAGAPSVAPAPATPHGARDRRVTRVTIAPGLRVVRSRPVASQVVAVPPLAAPHPARPDRVAPESTPTHPAVAASSAAVSAVARPIQAPVRPASVLPLPAAALVRGSGGAIGARARRVTQERRVAWRPHLRSGSPRGRRG